MKATGGATSMREFRLRKRCAVLLEDGARVYPRMNLRQKEPAEPFLLIRDQTSHLCVVGGKDLESKNPLSEIPKCFGGK